MVAIALTIAGSDSGGGAGIQADLKTFSSQGVYGASAITAVTAQNTRCVDAVYALPCGLVEQQIRAVLSDFDVRAMKIGMLGMPDMIECVARAVSSFDGPIVLDPVMVAKSGDELLPSEAIDALRNQLVPRATLLTPNIPEAAKLLDEEVACDVAGLHDQGLRLQKMGAGNVLMKGGHSLGATCTDWLMCDGWQRRFLAPRIETKNTHGTGCSYSSAIAARLALGEELEVAVSYAHAWLHEAIVTADQLGVGQGHGPVNHFHQYWS